MLGDMRLDQCGRLNPIIAVVSEPARHECRYSAHHLPTQAAERAVQWAC